MTDVSTRAVDPAYVTAKPVNPAGLPTAYEHGGRLTPEGSSVDPILVEIVQGTLASVEMEVETAIGRTSRSPMIRDAHDFRAGIHDRQLRKLTGRCPRTARSRRSPGALSSVGISGRVIGPMPVTRRLTHSTCWVGSPRKS